MLSDKKQRIEDTIEEAKPGEPEKAHFSVPWLGFLIVLSVIITLMVVCVVVILLNGGFYQW